MKRYINIIFYFCLTINIFFSFVGLDHSLLEVHSFRQTQTAMTAYYTLETGCQIEYETPVLGPPWSLPFEFPLYQWTVAGVYNIFDFSSLEVAGRLVSYVFYWFSLLFIFLIIRHFIEQKENRLVLISLLLLTPTYLYWSRTFMIESTAFMFGMIYIWSALSFMKGNRILFLIIGLISGILAGLVKSTTLMIYFLPVALTFFFYCDKTDKIVETINKTKKLITGFIYIIIPLVVSILWTLHADAIRNRNPLIDVGNFSWTLGTMEQKAIMLGLFALSTSLIYVALKKFKYRKEIIAMNILFWSAPIIFSNLYMIHDYYYFVNMVFLTTAVSYFLFSLFEHKSSKVSKLAYYIIYPLILIIFLGAYLVVYFPRQYKNNDSLDTISSIVKENTQKTDIMLIYGHDWNSSVPYYCQRRAIMDKFAYPLENKIIRYMSLQLGDNKITAMLVRNDYVQVKGFVEKRLKAFGFPEKPVYRDLILGNLYLLKK